MGIIQEFKDFAVKGNVIDMAVGIIIGGAFGKIVSSFVADIIMPPLGLLIGGINFTELAITLKASNSEAPAVLLKYGQFIQAIMDFTIIALAIFIAIKGLNSLKRKEAQASRANPLPSKEEILLTEIRDILKNKK